MPEWIEYPPGTPSWVDLTTSDVDAAAGFYGALFGWEAVEAGPPEETGGYRMFTLGGALVGGLGPKMSDDQVTAWATYIATADADATAEAVQRAGGQVAVAPMDVMTAGRMAVFADPTGAFFGVWQPGDHRGAQVVNADGALTWNEVETDDPEAAKRFYADVFGWDAEPIEVDGKVVYVTLKLGGRTIGGLLPQLPPGVPPNWLVYFGVADLDAAAAQVEQLGGSVLMPRRDVPAGSFAVFADPQGAVFACLQGAYDPPPG